MTATHAIVFVGQTVVSRMKCSKSDPTAVAAQLAITAKLGTSR